MKRLLGIFALIMSISVVAYAAVVHNADGVKIGPDSTGNDRLPIYDADEWCVESGIGTMSGNETRTLTFTDLPTFRLGQNLNVQPMNPEHASYPQVDLLISHAYVPTPGTVKILIRNLSSSSRNFGSDQLCILGFNTSNPN